MPAKASPKAKWTPMQNELRISDDRAGSIDGEVAYTTSGACRRRRVEREKAGKEDGVGRREEGKTWAVISATEKNVAVATIER